MTPTTTHRGTRVSLGPLKQLGGSTWAFLGPTRNLEGPCLWACTKPNRLTSPHMPRYTAPAVAMASTVPKIHGRRAYKATSSQVGHDGGGCGWWCKAPVAASGIDCHRLSNVGDDEVVYSPEKAVRRKWRS